jgi:hypothetical protein
MGYLNGLHPDIYNTLNKLSMALMMAVIMDGNPDGDCQDEDIGHLHDQESPVDFRGPEIMGKDLIQGDPMDHKGTAPDETPGGLPVAEPERRKQNGQKQETTDRFEHDPSEFVHGATSCVSRVGPSVAAPVRDRFYAKGRA